MNGTFIIKCNIFILKVIGQKNNFLLFQEILFYLIMFKK